MSAVQTMQDAGWVDRTLSEFARGVAALEGPKRFSDADLARVYAIAHGYYTQGRFAEAGRYFAFLAFYRPLDPVYLTGLGASRQMAKDFPGAIEAYSFATLLAPENPEPSLHVAECLLGMGEVAPAREALRMVVNLCRLKSGHEDVQGRAQALLSLLEQKR